VLRRTALFLFLLSPVLLVSQQQQLTILSSAGRRAIATTTANEQEYVGIDDLATAFQLAVREDSPGMLAVTYKGKTILLTQDQPLGSVSGRIFSLPAPPVRSIRRWLVPVDFIGRGLALVYDQKLTLRRPSNLVIVGDLRVPRVQLKYETPSSNTGRLTVDATPRASSTISQDGDQLLVKFDADAIDFANAALLPGALIQNVRVVDATTIAFTVGPRFGAFKVATQVLDTSTRQTIDITAGAQQPPAETPPPSPAPVPALPPQPDLASLANAGSPQLRTIAIDPGHGGDDEGVKGAQGTIEKDVTLAVARKLKTALETRLGVRVLLTRDDDRNVHIDDRTAVANSGKADLFISLHANASWRPSLSGATIATAMFEQQSEQAARALAPELVPSIGGVPRDIEFIPWDSAQIPHLDQSAMLARAIQEQMQGHVPLAGTPRESAPLRVLEPANMPAVLIEMGYLSNAAQEKQLSGDVFQNTLVQSLVDGVMRYRELMGFGR
jgi:N-acetylmuramoyl-L-alanine amidase